MRLGTVHPEVSHIPGCERGLRTPYNCRRLLSSAVPEVEVPDTLALPAELRPGYTLFAWQDRAYRWLKNRKGALLIHSAGAGKTYTAICAALHHGGPVVWVTKATLKRQVYREVRQRSFVDPLVLEGETPHLIPEGTRMVIVNYDVLHAWRKVLTEFVRGGVFVGDELHTAKASKRYTKTVDPETGRIIYDTLWNVSSCTAAIAEAAAKRIGLTATPQPNSREDLWSQLDIIEPGCWGNWWNFVHRYCAAKPGKHGGIDASGESNTEELKARLREVMHTVRKSELLAELPPMRRELLYISVEEQCRPSGGMAAEMKAAAKAGAMSLLEAKFAESSARKRNWVEKFVQDILDQGLKVCIMTGRRIDVEALQRTLEKPAKKAGVPLWAIHGGHPLDMRDSAVLAYMGTQGKGALLIGTGECLGTGTNLQDTDVALFVMLPYTPGGIVQWEGRFSRPGQTRAVRIIYAIAQGTVDETVCDILLDKLESVEKTTDDPEAGSVARLLGGADDEKILQQLLNNI